MKIGSSVTSFIAFIDDRNTKSPYLIVEVSSIPLLFINLIYL